MSDEAYFYLTESLNRQNNRIYDIEQPTDGISTTKIYGPYYFSTSVNQHNYLEMLKVWCWAKHLRTSEYKKYYFQQDGTPPQTSNIVKEWLASKFGQKFLA